MNHDKKNLAMVAQLMNHYWEDRAKSYGEQNRAQLQDEHANIWQQLILENIPKKKSLKILDIGTGPGFLAILMALAGHQVTGVDMNSEMLNEARENARLAGVNVCWQQVGQTLPFLPLSFDVIITRDVTWTLTAPETTLEHWMSKVAPGGTLLYFDAQWYGYLKNDESRREFKAHRRYVEENNGFVYEKAAAMEVMARTLPMTYKERPQWDLDFWRQRHYEVTCHENLNPMIYNDLEQLQYEKQQEFLVVVKNTSDPNHALGNQSGSDGEKN